MAPSPLTPERTFGTRAFFERRRALLKRSVAEQRAAVEAGDTAILTDLAHRMNLRGDRDSALRFARRAASAGDPEAFPALALYGPEAERESWSARGREQSLWLGWQDYWKAPSEEEWDRLVELAKKRITLGDPAAEEFLLSIYFRAGKAKALRDQVELSCARELPMAHCFAAYLAYAASPRDPKRVLRFARAGARTNSIAAMACYARCLYEGVGVERDFQRARQWLGRVRSAHPARNLRFEEVRLAYELGDWKSWKRLRGELLATPREAATWWDWEDYCMHLVAARRAAKHPEEDLEDELLEVFSRGSPTVSVYADYVAIAAENIAVEDEQEHRAIRATLIQRAFDLGRLESEAELGELLVLGDGVSPDHQRGRAHLEDAARRNDLRGLYTLGKFHLEGLGGFRQDVERGVVLLERARVRSFAPATKRLSLHYYHNQRIDEALLCAQEILRQDQSDYQRTQVAFLLVASGKDVMGGLETLVALSRRSEHANLALADIYADNGLYVKQNHELAAKYKERARLCAEAAKRAEKK